ncbi:hypothetical protein B0A54_14061 [Friedmanniomyces endolithicus]|uniref:MmgE/PrpD family protein n=1 Tax=Friedmanniomyces endolithicus TaxID=329885 RepID=A0A4U0UGZ1_9PEZI|nr:hypothetical protein B0A54_14061 [Friedmanniomyces endolithicus]
MAFGLAGSKAAGSMQYLDNGSWNKRLHPGFAVHDAFMCVALAEAGVVGASRILEGTSGFLKAYTPSESVSLERLVGGLGEEWGWLGSSLKPYPACRMTHAFIELSGDMQTARAKGSTVSPDDIGSVELRMSPANYILVGDPTPNKRHPTNVIDAQFSAYFQLTDKISVKTDESMSGFGAKMSVQWIDGQLDSKEQQFPLGETEHPFTRDKVEEKFMALAVPR